MFKKSGASADLQSVVDVLLLYEVDDVLVGRLEELAPEHVALRVARHDGGNGGIVTGRQLQVLDRLASTIQQKTISDVAVEQRVGTADGMDIASWCVLCFGYECRSASTACIMALCAHPEAHEEDGEGDDAGPLAVELADGVAQALLELLLADL